MSRTPFFNAHHSPIGAFATLTLGCKGQKGGFGLELGGPADESVYVGVESATEPGKFQALPFYGGAEIAAADYDVEGHSDMHQAESVSCFADTEITRTFGPAIDTWRAGDLTFRIISTPKSIADVDLSPDDPTLPSALRPAVFIEVTVDNSKGTFERKAFFGYGGSDRYAGMRILQEPGLVGVGQGTSVGIATDDPTVYAGLGWQPEVALTPRLEANLGFMLGSLGLLVGTVPAGEVRTFRFVAAFYRDGIVTTGLRTRYLYQRWFNSVESVLKSALASIDEEIAAAEAFEARFASTLTEDRRFMLAHAIRSYYGSTQLLEDESGKALWVIHEGEYRMMNTFDLTVDQAFYELALHPWTVRNVLDQFVSRYSYTDSARFPGDATKHPGGIAFTHDMGVANNFSRPGHSGYEQAGLTGCFSYMCSEELLNWVLCAGLYVSHTSDSGWAVANKATLIACLESLENRDNPDVSLRNGVMGLDGDRCQGGAEITTYDSLDVSLGQARNNLYMAVKGWAAYLLLEQTMRGVGLTAEADRCRVQANLAVQTILGAVDSEGLLPAVIGEGVESRIIPAIEALVYPAIAGLGEENEALKATLLTHLLKVLKPGVCLFEDGGWKLSSTSNNSWLSKIYLCQYVAEQILAQDADEKADAAHVGWLLNDENVYYAWSDQILSGKAVGSKYYPRGVTAALWLSSPGDPIGSVRKALLG